MENVVIPPNCCDDYKINDVQCMMVMNDVQM